MLENTRIVPPNLIDFFAIFNALSEPAVKKILSKPKGAIFLISCRNSSSDFIVIESSKPYCLDNSTLSDKMSQP